MAYRSEVKIVAGKNAAKELRKVNKKYDYFTETKGDNGEWLFECNWIKWYEDEEDVAAYMDVVNKYMGMEGADNGINFMRIGEDSEDVEKCSNYSTVASLYSGIVVDSFAKKEPKKHTTGRKSKAVAEIEAKLGELNELLAKHNKQIIAIDDLDGLSVGDVLIVPDNVIVTDDDDTGLIDKSQFPCYHAPRIDCMASDCSLKYKE